MNTTAPAMARPEGEGKPWFLSKGIIGGVVALIAGAVGLSDVDSAQLTQLITDALSIVGGALAIYGRVKAKQAIV